MFVINQGIVCNIIEKAWLCLVIRVMNK